MRVPSRNRLNLGKFCRAARLVAALTAVVLAGCASSGHGPSGSAAAHPAAATLAQARQAYEGGRYVEALHLLLPLARAGNAEAQYSVGYLYFYGFGTNRNKGEALTWIRRAAAQGNRRAVSALRSLLAANAITVTGTEGGPMSTAAAAFRAGDYRRAHRDWLKLAQDGDCRAQLALARMNEFGVGTKASFAAASRWYRLALAHKCPGADAILQLVRPPPEGKAGHGR